MPTKPLLLSIVEAGGYPNFKPLYQQAGYEVIVECSLRQVMRRLKKVSPALIVAEFNFQSDFRDRTSSLETLMSVVSRQADIQTLIFYDQEQSHQFDRLKARFSFDHEMPFPIDANRLREILTCIPSE